MEQEPKQEQTFSVLILSASEDDDLRSELEKHLIQLIRNNKITIWTNLKILPGVDTHEAYRTALEKASVILLLISRFFLADEQCYQMMESALPRYRSDAVPVIPILLSPVFLEDVPFNSLQWLPRNKRAITQWENRDEAFQTVISEIHTLLENIPSTRNKGLSVNPDTLNIILATITDGLISIKAMSGRKAELVITKDLLTKWESVKTILQPILQNALNKFIEDVQWSDPAKEQLLRLFLSSPEIEGIIRHIYTVTILEISDQAVTSSIRVLFSSMLLIFIKSYSRLNKREEERLINGTKFLCDALFEGCNLTFKNAIDIGLLAIYDDEVAFQDRILPDEVNAIQRKVDYFANQQSLDVRDILAFEKKYRQQVNSRHKNVTPPYLDVAKKISIDKIYIYPHFTVVPNQNASTDENKISDKHEVLDVLQFLACAYRTVVLGNPGGGKSTLALKICYELTARNTKMAFAGRKQITPILVILREYGAEKKARNCSILQFIEGRANACYQIQPPSGAFEYLLLSCRVIVIFDGLDELLDTTFRQEITSDIESFCSLYPSVPILVTSREVGYEQVPLDEEKFSVFRLAPFDDKQVEEYVKKWFSLAYKDLLVGQRESKVQAFIKESQLVPDLRSNPLMLALLCVIYLGENYIPRNRPDVYEKCAIMLFERWDKSRGINANITIDWHIRPLMEYLAYWIFSNDQLRGGVTEEELRNKTIEYIYEWLFDDYIKAGKIAEQFIDFCIGRAWVFTDTGTKKEGEKLFQFTHTTFLEYFAASHLVRSCRTPIALLKVLRSKIIKQEWDVMAQLSFQIQNKRVVGAGDELLSQLIEYSRQDKTNDSWNFLKFALRCLEFIVPRPKVTREIIKVWFDYSLAKKVEWHNERGSSQKQAETEIRKISLILERIVSHKSIENASTITEYVSEYVASFVNHGNEIEAETALDIGLYILPKNDAIFTKCFNRLQALYPKYFWLCYYAVDLNKLSIIDLMKWYGIEGIFRMQDGFLIRRVSIGLLILRRVLDSPHDSAFSYWINNHVSILDDMGDFLLAHSLPYLKLSSVDLDIFSDWWCDVDHLPDTQVIKLLELSSSAYFSIFVLLSIVMEARAFVPPDKRSMKVEQLINMIKGSKCLLFSSVRWIFCARYGSIAAKKIQGELDKCKFTELQQGLVWRWIRKEVNFCE